MTLFDQVEAFHSEYFFLNFCEQSVGDDFAPCCPKSVSAGKEALNRRQTPRSPPSQNNIQNVIDIVEISFGYPLPYPSHVS
jgi:hypothetical protein